MSRQKWAKHVTRLQKDVRVQADGGEPAGNQLQFDNKNSHSGSWAIHIDKWTVKALVVSVT